MDGLDIKILGQLTRGWSSHGFQPEGVKGVYGRIAKNLGLDEDTVRKRVDRLESAGVIKGWRLIPNSNSLGLKRFLIWMTVGPKLRIDEALRKIRLVHGVFIILREVGDVLGIALLCGNEEEFRKKVELISELVRPKELKTYAGESPRVDVSLTPTDFMIIKALRPNPLISYVEVAKKLGLSSRTVRRRMSRLTQGNAIFFMPDIDFGRLEGVSCVDLFVDYTASKFKGEVDRSIATKFQDYLLRAGWGSANHGHFEFLVPNVRVTQEIIDWARGLQGVGEVDLKFRFESLNFSDDVLEEVFGDRISGASERSLKKR